MLTVIPGLHLPDASSTTSPPSWDSQECLQTLLSGPWGMGQNHLWLRNNSLETFNTVNSNVCLRMNSSAFITRVPCAGHCASFSRIYCHICGQRQQFPPCMVIVTYRNNVHTASKPLPAINGLINGSCDIMQRPYPDPVCPFSLITHTPPSPCPSILPMKN